MPSLLYAKFPEPQRCTGLASILSPTYREVHIFKSLKGIGPELPGPKRVPQRASETTWWGGCWTQGLTRHHRDVEGTGQGSSRGTWRSERRCCPLLTLPPWGETQDLVHRVRAILWVAFTEVTGPQEWLRSLRKERGPRPQTHSPPSHLLCFSADPVAKPIVEANSTTVTEHEDTVVLKCLTNDTGVAISWFFNGQSLLLTERMELSQDNGTLTIEPVRREDAGHYQCEASNPGNSSLSDPLRLDVKCKWPLASCSTFPLPMICKKDRGHSRQNIVKRPLPTECQNG